MDLVVEFTQFKKVLDCFPASVAILTRAGKALYINESWKSSFNESSCALNYFSSFLDELGDETVVKQKATEGIERVLNGSIPSFSFEYSGGDRNGEKWFMMTVKPFAEIPDNFILVNFEITKFKIAEDRSKIFATLLEYNSDGTKFLLQEPDGSYAILAMLEKTSEGLTLTDSNYFILFANRSLTAMHGYEEGELTGRDVRVLLDENEIAIHNLESPFSEGSLSFDGELTNKSKDGSHFPTMAYKRALVSSKATYGYVWTFHDISKLKESEIELNRRARELEAKIRQLNCLYQISELTTQPRITLAQLLQQIVDLIPPATRYPNKIGASIQFGSETFSAGPVDQNSWERSFDIVVEDKTAATLTLCFSPYYQGDETFEIFEDEISLIRVVGEHLGRLIERYGLVAELEQHSGDQYRELSGLELVSGPKLTPVATQTYGQGPLSKTQPEEFNVLLDRYEEALDLLLDQKTYKVDHKISERLRDIANEIGFLRGGPRDVVELHSAAVKNKTRGVPRQKAKAYFTEGKFLAFGVLGHLTSFYRNRSIFVSSR
jgi:PAS domain S-box-containing protein